MFLDFELKAVKDKISNQVVKEGILKYVIFFLSFSQERRLAQQKVECLHMELMEKEKEIEQYKYKLKVKCDELEREKHDRADEVVLLTHEIDNLKYMKNAAMSQYDEHNDLLKQMEIIKKVRI